MRSTPSNTPRNTSLSIRLGGWFEANATGWGVVAVPLVLGLVLAAALLRLWAA